MKNCTYQVRTALLICVFVIAGMLTGFSQQIAKGLNSSTGDYLGFLEYKPADYDKTTTRYPVIIFLHGIGERGNGTTMLQDVTCCGIPRMIRLGHKMRFTWNGKTETFIVLSPQCPEKYGMWPAAFVTDLINYAKNNLRIDANRIFLTGLSMGGGGTFRFISTAADQPKQLAAAAPICTPCTFSNPVYPTDAHLPIWAFHAADDPAAPVTCTYAAIDRLNDFNPNPKPLMTIWPTGGHIIWDRVYTDTAYKWDGVVNIYEWFLGQNKALPVNVMPVARAGNTINITTGTGTATLNASTSTDADGRIVRYVWRKISGPLAGVITTPFGTNSSTTVTGLTTAGTYQYQLNVVDDRAAVSRDTVSVVVSSGGTVANIAPVAKAGSDATITLPTNTVNLNGTGSTDQDGSIASYLWTKVSGPSATIASPSSATTAVNGLVQGTYVFKLRVTDNRGAISEDQMNLVVNATPNAAPVARAGNDVTITLPTSTVTLSGTTSADSDGTITNYLWTKVSGPAATIVSSSSASTNVSGLAQGTYVFKLRVTDNDGAYAEDWVTVTVNAAPNAAPVARAGADITITLPTSSITLNGSTSTDSDGTISGYLWTKVSGPSATITSSSSATTTVTGLVQGTYVFKVRVTDNDGAIAEDQLTVTVNAAPNAAPVARAGADITITLPTSTITLNGSASTDSDGTISNYLWAKVSGPSATITSSSSASTTVTGLVQGTYVFKVRVTDNDGAFAEDQLTVTVNAAPNAAPVARAGSDVIITLPVTSATLNGSTSTDSDGTITGYLWTKVSGPAATITSSSSATTTITGLVEGTYVFKLRVTDNDGATSEDQVTVTVNPAPNAAPVARAGADVAITLPTNSVTLNGSGSTDKDGTITNYQWIKTSGPAATIVDPSSASTEVTGLVQGTYVFKLIITDNDGATGEDQMIVNVGEAANQVPVADAGSDITITLPVNTVTLDGAGSTDSDGTIKTYTWTKSSGPAATIVNASGSTTEVTNLTEGTYVFTLTVTDNDGAVSEDDVTVIVGSAENTAPSAIASNDITITLPVNSVALNGTSSTDEDGTIETYQWTKVSGPAASIGNPTGSSTTVNGLVEGSYVFRLTVTDNDGASSQDEVNVVVNAAPNVAPIARAGADITITLPVNSVMLNGSSSTDTDGFIASYVWTKVSGGTASIADASSATTRVGSLAAGTYVFKLKVTDNGGASAEDQVIVKVNAEPNVLPEADAGSDVTLTLPENKTVLTGSSSSDADGTIDSYAWAKISGPTQFIIADAAVANTNLTNLTEGTYKFRLTVTDNKGGIDADTVIVKVNAALPQANVVPIAQAGANQTITLPNDNAALNGTASSDADGTIESYNWSFLSGPETFTLSDATSAMAGVSGMGVGTYVFMLEVTDNEGASDTDTVEVTVKEEFSSLPPVNVAPIAVAGGDITITLPINEVSLDGSNSTDEDGGITSFTWTKVSGPTTFNILSSDKKRTVIENLVEGTYVFQLLVKDNDGALGRDAVTVKVLGAPNETPTSDAGADFEVQLPDETIELNGSNSFDPNGTIAEYSWEQVSGPNSATIVDAASATTAITGVEEGEYIFRLIVTDNEGTRASDVVHVVVIAEPIPNVAPIADAGDDLEVTLPDPTIELNGTRSTDPDGSITSYSWVKVSGPGGITITNSTRATPGIIGVVEGEYVFRLTVTDSDGATATDEVKLTVHPAAAQPPPARNEEPVADAGDDKTISYPDSTTTISGANSTDTDGSISDYRWTMAEGPAPATIENPTSPSTVISNLQAGEYTFVLTVIDDQGAVSKDTVAVSVINTMRFQEDLMVYPNPARSTINMQLMSDTTGNTRITIYNSNGMVVQTINTEKDQPQLLRNLNISNLQNGLYYLEVIVAGKERKITKFIKR